MFSTLYLNCSCTGEGSVIDQYQLSISNFFIVVTKYSVTSKLSLCGEKTVNSHLFAMVFDDSLLEIELFNVYETIATNTIDN